MNRTHVHKYLFNHGPPLRAMCSRLLVLTYYLPSYARCLQANAMYDGKPVLLLARRVRLGKHDNIIIVVDVLLPCRHLVLIACGRSTPIHDGLCY